MICLCKVVKSNWYIRFVGANTLTYFALHGKLYAVIEMLLAKLVGDFYRVCLSNGFTSSLLAIVITFAMSLILIIPAMIINRWFPWVLGRTGKGKTNGEKTRNLGR